MSNWSTQVDLHNKEVLEIDAKIASLKDYIEELQMKRKVHLDVLAILYAADHVIDDTKLILNKIPLVDAEKLPLDPEILVLISGKLLPHTPELLLTLASIGAKSITSTRNVLGSLGGLLSKPETA